ncbi:MAG TPA: hypothetical protein HPP66_03105 [Planctomycetes bacterium]|nr:hypothetical protein [Planctomycetota bacterium]
MYLFRMTVCLYLITLLSSPVFAGIQWSTFLGGSSGEIGKGIARDSSGNIYVTGTTTSSNLATDDVYDEFYNGGKDVFVAKFNSSGSDLIYFTYIGGGNDEEGLDIFVDSSGNAYVTGWAESDFPTTPGAYDRTYSNQQDVFVLKLSSDGSDLLYSTYIGDEYCDHGYGIAVDSSSNIYVAGYTSSPDFPTKLGAFDTEMNGSDAGFLLKFNSTLSDLLYSTFVDGDNIDSCSAIALSGNDAYVTGYTHSTDFPTTEGAYDRNLYPGTVDAFIFIFRISSISQTLLYSTYIGGAGGDFGTGIALDSSGDVYITGETASTTGFPIKNAYDSSHNGGTYDVFVTQIDPEGNGSNDLVRSTYIGGSSNDYGEAIDLMRDLPVVTGYTDSTNFPTTIGAYDRDDHDDSDVFVSVLKTYGVWWELNYSTYVGGSGRDRANAIVANSNRVYVTGYTTDDSFPTTTGAYDEDHGGSSDVFVFNLRPVPEDSHKFYIKNNSGDPVAWFGNLGNLVLKGSLTPNTTPQASANDEFRIQDSIGDDVAIIDATNGNMYIKGSRQSTWEDPSAESDEFIIESSTGPVGYINELGNLYLKGQLYENAIP